MSAPSQECDEAKREVKAREVEEKRRRREEEREEKRRLQKEARAPSEAQREKWAQLAAKKGWAHRPQCLARSAPPAAHRPQRTARSRGLH